MGSSKGPKLNKGKCHREKQLVLLWVYRVYVNGSFKAPERFLWQPRISIDPASVEPYPIRIGVERDRSVSHFDLTFTIGDHERRDCGSHRQRIWIIVVDARCQAKKPNCFLPVELRIGRIAIKDVLHVTATCQ